MFVEEIFFLIFNFFSFFVLDFLKDACAFDKFAIDHESTIDYDTSSIKTMDQFTLCSWIRFTKHDGDHVIFTYSGEFYFQGECFWSIIVNNYGSESEIYN